MLQAREDWPPGDVRGLLVASGLSGDDLPWPARHLSLQSCHCRKSGHLIGSTLASWPPNNNTSESLATCLADCYSRLATNMDLTLSLAGRGRYGRHIVQNFGDNKGCSTLFILHRRGSSLVEQYKLVSTAIKKNFKNFSDLFK